MSDLHRSTKADVELGDRSGKRPIRPTPKTRKIITAALAVFIGAAIIVWLVVLGWGLFVAGRWLLSFFSSV